MSLTSQLEEFKCKYTQIGPQTLYTQGSVTGLRPKASALFLERPRLLRLLPEEAGYVVWLEAPYGYGKSVLISQWIRRLEHGGWRVVWLALPEGDLRPGLALALGLPDTAPWLVVLQTLALERTAVVLEDLEGDEELTPLLKHNPGLVLLASRRRLRDPEIPRLRSEGRLIHVRAEQMAFTQEEAAELFGQTAGALEAWEQTRGWSLPLHLAALTGEIPSEEGLWEGVRESLEQEEWREVLFLASLPYLPLDCADARDHNLARLGFVQALEQGYRLHPLAAEQLRSRYAKAVQTAVRLEAHRLKPVTRGLALERAGLWEELGALLVSNPGLGEQNPREVLRWDKLLPPTSDHQLSLLRINEVAIASGRLGQHRASAERFLLLARDPQATRSQALLAYGEAANELARVDLEQARQAVMEGDALLAEADPLEAAKYLNSSAGVAYWSNDIEAAVERYTRALALEPSGALRTSLQYNLSLMRWWLDGDGAALLAAREQLIRDPAIPPGKLAFYCRNAGIKAVMTGFHERGAALLEKTLEYADADPLSALQAEAMLALLERRLEDMPAIWARLLAWDNANASDRILASWILALLEAGRNEEALARLGEDRGSSSSFAGDLLALVLWANGRQSEALAALPQPLDLVTERERCFYIRATRFRVTRDEAELEALLSISVERERPLVYYLPLSELPRHRPQLARYYPIHQVLHSGWKEAIALRLEEVPPLELKLLGGFEAKRLGQPVALNPRPRAALTLMALGFGREQMAEAIWPELDSDKSRNNLHVTLNQLRKSLEPWGVATYLFEAGLRNIRCDLWELEKALAAKDSSAIQKLYAELTPDSDLDAIVERRQRLREKAVEVVFDSLEPGDPQAEDTLEWILGLDPLHEEALSKLLELLLKSGRKVSALRRYREFAERLKAELGLEPAPQTQQMLT